MNLVLRPYGVLSCMLALSSAGPAFANTLNQNTSWTIRRPGAAQTYRVVAYGDSIFAGYYGSLNRVVRRAGPYVGGEYFSRRWNANVEVVRRAKSGAKADDIYHNKIVAERSYMQAPSTRVVMFEMCGNDYLQARSDINGQTGTCDFGPLDNALAACSAYMERAMQAIHQYAAGAAVKVIANIYYPGYDADNSPTRCNDPATGTPSNKQNKFLPVLARSNWRACNLAERYGFACADSFAEYMAAEYDSNGDGLVDIDGIRYRRGESEDEYVRRLSVTQRATIRDANVHFVDAGISFDYLLSDNTHPTYYGSTVGLSWFSGAATGSSPPDFSDAQIIDGANPEWNRSGHEKMGWAVSITDPVSP